jgi:hypothetical protein
MTNKNQVSQITYKEWDSEAFKELQNSVVSHIVNVAKENNLTGEDFTECVLDLCKKFTSSYEAECGVKIVEHLTGKEIVRLVDVLKQGDKIRRKSDGKVFTYTEKSDSDYKDYGHVEEMAVAVYLPDFEKVEDVWKEGDRFEYNTVSLWFKGQIVKKYDDGHYKAKIEVIMSDYHLNYREGQIVEIEPQMFERVKKIETI